MKNLEKLIKDGGWLPVEEYKPNTEILRPTIIPTQLLPKIIEKGLPPRRFMLPDTPERMAKVIEVLANGLEWVVGYEGNQHTTAKAKETIQEANEIAGE